MEKILELEPTDDITAIRSRIDFALTALAQQAAQAGQSDKRPRLLLLVPRKNKALQSLVSMKLLARLVKARAVEMAIVSAHPTVRDYAKEAGLKAFANRLTARWGGWITAEAPVAAPAETLPPVAESAPEKTTDAGQISPRRRQQKKKYRVVSGERPGLAGYLFRQVGMFALLFVIALALVVGVIALLPEATVTITPVAQPVEASLVVKADPEATTLDFEELRFPARVDQVELKLFGEIETIETELAPSGRARGQVVFINRTDSEQTIPLSTTLATGAGQPMEFTTLQTATIPAGAGATSPPVTVEAQQPGPRSNVAAGQINRIVDSGPARVARVINEAGLSGGFEAPTRVVVQDDKPRLDAHLRQMVQQEGLEQLQASLGEQEFIPPKSVQVIVLDVKYQEFAGDFSDTFGGEMQGVVRATVIGGYNANRLALAALEAQVPPGFELDLEGLQFGAGEVLNIEERVVFFRIFAEGQAIPQIDDREVAQAIAWLPIGQAQQLLSRQYRLAGVPGVELQPEWLVDLLGRLPFSSLRIEVVINDPVELVAGGE